ncbi:hypothetical protein BH11PLA1_BH11PLA1_18030 [soil metagenome]
MVSAYGRQLGIFLSTFVLTCSSALCAVSTMSLSVGTKDIATINAGLCVVAPPGQDSQFNGTITEPGGATPATNNLVCEIGSTLSGVTFTRLADDTVTAVDALGNKFWILIKSDNTTITASITNGKETLVTGEFTGVWYNDTGGAGAQSIPHVLATMVAQQATPPATPPAAPEPAKPTFNECLTAAIATCKTNGGVKSVTYTTMSGSCAFVCNGTIVPAGQ